MPPTTRSSAPTTPLKKATGGGLATPSTTPRRVPHCKTCGRPRAGHPRRGCPNPPLPADGDYDSQLTDELESLHIVQARSEPASPLDTRDAKEKQKRRLSVRFALAPQESLASLSTSSSEIVNRLLEPGIMDDDSTDDVKEGILRWQHSLGPSGPEETKSLLNAFSRRMPGTLRTPTPSLASTQPISSQESSFDMNKTVWMETPKSKAIGGPRPLGRTMSVEERSSFIGKLSNNSHISPAMLFSVESADLDSLQQEARKVGYHTHALPGEQEGQRWLILGRDQKAVELLALRFKEETAKTKQSGGLRAAAGGALVGAVATWTGLAFS
ncbi:hypothetical protein BJ138DRAFT_1144007 [Hygrophoropsis aurantiaca]|uniref:Uncharacterized protein n=1 Tax=Hygrophoropsis aurantiaca TaxID=72124 RepID=A0ACB8AM18_9AGAM|nr:hypothetical protein BJ138DRAFT_1144007 [Hygrophoropsis aurantiaca]